MFPALLSRLTNYHVLPGYVPHPATGDDLGGWIDFDTADAKDVVCQVRLGGRKVSEDMKDASD